MPEQVKRVAMVSGGFDPLHVGHLDMIIGAAAYGRVVVALNSDAWLTRKKGHPFMEWEDRARILNHIREVSEVVPVDDADGTVCEALRRVRPDYFCNGGDRTIPHPAEEAVCRELGIAQAFNVGGGKIRSSSDLVRAAIEMRVA